MPKEWLETAIEPEQSPPHGGTIQFKAVDNRTGAAISDYHLRVEGAEADSHFFIGHFFTDDNGLVNVRYPQVPLLYLTLWANHDQYPPKIIQWDTRHHGSVPREYVYRVEKGVPIGGFVKDMKGQPVANAVLRFQGPRFNIDSGEIELAALTKVHTRSDAAGKWEFDGIPDDLESFQIIIQHPDYQTTGAMVSSLGGNRFAPNQCNLATLRAKEQTISLSPGTTVVGRVVGPAREAISGASVFLGRSIERARISKTDPDGKFEFRNVSDRTIVLTAQADGYAQASATSSASTLNVPVEIVMTPAKTIRGIVTDAYGNPIFGAEIKLSETGREQTGGWRGFTDEQGRFVCTSAPDRDVWLSASRTGYRTETPLIHPSDFSEVRITLNEALWLTGTIRNSRNGRPIPFAKLATGFRSNSNESIRWSAQPQAIGKNGRYSIHVETPRGRETFVRVEAPGYLRKEGGPFVTPGRQTADFDLDAYHLP